MLALDSPFRFWGNPVGLWGSWGLRQRTWNALPTLNRRPRASRNPDHNNEETRDALRHGGRLHYTLHGPADAPALLIGYPWNDGMAALLSANPSLGQTLVQKKSGHARVAKGSKEFLFSHRSG